MQALSVIGPHHVQVVERPIPDIKDDEALLKTAAAMICHTDHFILSGQHPHARYPVTPGHEFSVVVVAVGSRVTHLQPGTRVAVQTLLSCGHCRHCWRGHINLCDNMLELGSLLPGGCEEYVAVPALALHPIADHFSLEEAAARRMELAVAAQGVDRGHVRLLTRDVMQSAGQLLGEGQGQPAEKGTTLQNPEGQPLETKPLPPEMRNGVAYFLDCLRNDKPIEGPVSASLNVAVNEILDAAIESVRTGRTVKLPAR
jgi:hypothetical protein